MDNTGRFLYVCVYNNDPSGNLAYTMEYRVRKDGTLRLLSSDEYNCEPAPTLLLASPSGPFMYMASKNGISAWRIKPDGTLHLLESRSTFLNVLSFVVDARDNLLIGNGQAVAGGSFSADQLAVWHRLPDGTLTGPDSAFIANDGFLYADEKDTPDGRSAFPRGIVFDADHHLLYVRDAATDRIFRYRVDADGALRLQAPWLSTGVETSDLIPVFSLFLGKGN